jgi:hypothetical protein
MKNKKTFITRTIQPRSWALLNEPGKDLTIKKSKTENNADLLLSVFESLYNLCEKLNRLNYEIQKRSIEQIFDEAIRQRNSKKGEKNEN